MVNIHVLHFGGMERVGMLFWSVFSHIGLISGAGAPGVILVLIVVAELSQQNVTVVCVCRWQRGLRISGRRPRQHPST